MNAPKISSLRGGIFLRPIGPQDLDILETWENDPEVWSATDFGTWTPGERPPYSRAQLAQFIENQQLGIDHTGQLRLVVCLRQPAEENARTPSREDVRPSETVDLVNNVSANSLSSPSVFRLGFVDLFDYDPSARTAQVGILIYRAVDRGRGYGTRALRATCDYAFGELRMRELRCSVRAENPASRAIFEKCGFAFDEKNGAGRKNTVFE